MELEWQMELSPSALPSGHQLEGQIVSQRDGAFLHVENPGRGYQCHPLPVVVNEPGRLLLQVAGRSRKGRSGVGLGVCYHPLHGTGLRTWRMLLPAELRGHNLSLMLSPGASLDLAAVRLYRLDPSELCFEVFGVDLNAPFHLRDGAEAALADLPFLERMATQAPVRVRMAGRDATRAHLGQPDPLGETFRVYLTPCAGAPHRQRRLGYSAWVIREASRELNQRSWWTPLPVPVTPEGERYLSSTALVQVDHPLVQRLAAEMRAASGVLGGYVARVGRWVLEWSRPPTVRPHDAASFMERHGTCIEGGHAAVALLRAAGIPARPTYVAGPYPQPTEMHCLPEVLGPDGWLPVHSMQEWYPWDRQLVIQHVLPRQEQEDHSARDGLMAYPGPWFCEASPICLAGPMRCEVWIEAAVIADATQGETLRKLMRRLWDAHTSCRALPSTWEDQPRFSDLRTGQELIAHLRSVLAHPLPEGTEEPLVGSTDAALP